MRARTLHFHGKVEREVDSRDSTMKVDVTGLAGCEYAAQSQAGTLWCRRAVGESALRWHTQLSRVLPHYPLLRVAKMHGPLSINRAL